MLRRFADILKVVEERVEVCPRGVGTEGAPVPVREGDGTRRRRVAGQVAHDALLSGSLNLYLETKRSVQ